MARLVVVAVACLVTACGGSDGGGTARLVDDTGLPDVADGGGWVALVPAGRADDLWEAAGQRPTEGLQYAAVPLTKAQVESVGGIAQAVSEDGEFDLGLAGDVLLCRVAGEDGSDGTRGCAVVELTEDDSIEISSGEGGLYVEQ